MSRTGFAGRKSGRLGRVCGLAVGGAATIAALSGAASPTRAAAPAGAAVSPRVANYTGALSSVAAVSATDAWATGETEGTGNLMLHWDGTQWTQETVPLVAFGGQLDGVSASSATDAWAVGQYSPGKPISRAEALHWNGTSWALTHLPSTGKPLDQNALNAVSDQAPNDVWAVGYRGSTFALALHWNGTAWAKTSMPFPANAVSKLQGVDALAPDDVWAVGVFQGTKRNGSLIMHWNGTSWSLLPSPDVDDLYGVSALSATDAWAAGTTGIGAGTNGVILHWDGTSWTPVPIPHPGGSSSYVDLFAINALSATDAWAVGDYGQLSGRLPAQKTLVLHWDGTSWTQVASPSVPKYSGLAGVFALSPTQAWAVGQLVPNAGSLGNTLAMNWDGTTWTRS